MSPDFQAIKVSVDLFHEALESLKVLKDLFPKGTKREQIESKLAEAERKIALSEAQFALLLGYKLCQCTFPPQIMLKSGPINGAENSACPKCGANSIRLRKATFAVMGHDPFDD